MTTSELRRTARETLDQLPADTARVAAEFLTYLGNHASAEATAELLKIPGILGD